MFLTNGSASIGGFVICGNACSQVKTAK